MRRGGEIRPSYQARISIFGGARARRQGVSRITRSAALANVIKQQRDASRRRVWHHRHLAAASWRHRITKGSASALRVSLRRRAWHLARRSSFGAHRGILSASALSALSIAHNINISSRSSSST